MMTELIRPYAREYEEYLRDESRRVGEMSAISFPTSEEQVIEVVKRAREIGESITIQGARTGIVAGSVPQGGLAMNLSRMNRIGTIGLDGMTGEHHLAVQPGAILSDVRKVVDAKGLFFPPDPTETSASIGGMTACNASGAMTFHYGPTRKWVRGLRMVLADGDRIELSRGENIVHGRAFSVKTVGGRTISGHLPKYDVPRAKAAAGYYVADDMDLIELFIGMEGTLAVITEIDLALLAKPSCIYGITVFLPCQKAAMTLVRLLRGETLDGMEQLKYVPVAVEFFNNSALELLRTMRRDYPAFEKIPALKEQYNCAVYAEFHGKNADILDEAVVALAEAISMLGGSDDDSWLATNDRELSGVHQFRHATPEAVNLLIDQRKREISGITKLGTDMSVPDCFLERIVDIYDSDLLETGLESVIFGHIGDNHLHVNILPRNMDEYDEGKSLYLKWAKQIVEMGGAVSAEHGIGKLKLPFLRMMYGDQGIEEMKQLRSLFDPGGILNTGNLF